MIKKFTCIILSLFIAISPCLAFCDFSYAEDETEPQWINMSSNEEFVAGMKAYAASRNNSSIFDDSVNPTGLVPAITIFSYSMWRAACNTLGFDIDQIQQNIKYRVSNNGTLQFLYDASIISDLNSIFEQVLQNYGISENEEDIIFSGEQFIDLDGNLTYVYKANFSYGSLSSTGTFYNDLSLWNEIGSNYKYDNALLYKYCSENDTSYPVVFNLTSSTTFSYNSIWYSHSQIRYLGGTLYGNVSSGDYAGNYYLQPIIYKDTLNEYYIGGFGPIKNNNNYKYKLQRGNKINGSVDTYDTDVTMKQGDDKNDFEDNKTAAIDVGKMGGDAALDALRNYINNQEPEEEPVVDPNVQDGNPTFPKPTGKTWQTGLNQDSNGNFNFTLPDLNFDWELDLDLNNLPFPFSIPHDLYNAFNSLNVQPETPRFQGTIDLVVYEWPVDIDFSDYSSLANVFRKWILFLYIVTLIIATRSVMHIY